MHSPQIQYPLPRKVLPIEVRLWVPNKIPPPLCGKIKSMRRKIKYLPNTVPPLVGRQFSELIFLLGEVRYFGGGFTFGANPPSLVRPESLSSTRSCKRSSQPLPPPMLCLKLLSPAPNACPAGRPVPPTLWNLELSIQTSLFCHILVSPFSCPS